MIYLTYNDQPSGVFSSQVNDVCNYLNKSLDARVRLVAIISLRSFFRNRNLIRNEVPGALVLPSLPKAKYWRFSCFVVSLVCLFTGEKIIVARNVVAAKIALFVKKTGLVKTVCLDGRGAIAAEWHEYDVIPYHNMKKNIARWEKTVVLDSDYRIAVSHKLVSWWNTAYGYKSTQHVVIPCTLQSSFHLEVAGEKEIDVLRKKEGFMTEDIIMVYSGSTSGWQSFGSIQKLLGSLLARDKKHKLVFLSKDDEIIDKMKKEYPGQIMNTWLNHSQVQSFLVMCDYGILYREKSITNQVAAPTKFAEYLSAGLPVIISAGIGDYSEFVQTHNCGIVISETASPVVEKTTEGKRIKMVQLASKHFTKAAHHDTYKELVLTLNKI